MQAVIEKGKYGQDGYFKSERQDYMTPHKEIIEPILNFLGIKEFSIDVCCSKKNIPAQAHLMPTNNPLDNSLILPWTDTCWMNPPFNITDKFVKKAVQEVAEGGCSVWSIMPARTETAYWHKFILNNPDCFYVPLRKGIGFIDPETNAIMGPYKNSLAIVYFGKNADYYCDIWNAEQPIAGRAFKCS